jgi:hypothetical protein
MHDAAVQGFCGSKGLVSCVYHPGGQIMALLRWSIYQSNLLVVCDAACFVMMINRIAALASLRWLVAVCYGLRCAP